VLIAGGAFSMGSEEHYREEAPVTRVSVADFWMDTHPVTNRQYAEFVAATGYVTVAERAPAPEEYPGALPDALVPGSLVFVGTAGPVDLRDFSQWWAWVPGADWRHPTGPGSSLESLENHPVVQVALADVEAYCAWAGAELPTEAEWEFAARGGLDGAPFAWGWDDPQESAPVANTWQGAFPYANSGLDGWERTSPVGAYPANGYGLLDMIGNVWELTADWYTASHSPVGEGTSEAACCAPGRSEAQTRQESIDVQQAQFAIPRRVIKGGSHLCTTQYCFRYRPAARQPQASDTGTSHVGFRTLVRRPAI
jgi:formylglycine-generating enzyme required for sulfatase activity